MDIENCLRCIHELSDLSRLVAALGHEPVWEAVPDEAWNRGTQRSLRVWAVGRTGEFPWLAVESRVPARDAITLAGRIQRRGRVGMVLVLDAEVRRLIVVLGFERLPSISLDLDHPDPEAVASLTKLAGVPDGGMLAFVAKAADALSSEGVGRRFFREFRATLDRMAAGLPGPMASDDRHGMALLQLTRVLFLYFIQTKGWLGRERFLTEQVDHCLARGRRIHRDLLRPLFFGTLNRPMQARSRIAAGFGPIPFLNGGLFEPHPLERRFRADIPDRVWIDAFERLFERFHFTVAERSRPGLVAPDMLGRVFEGVMAPDIRRASGTFYTPAALVQRVLDAALTALVASRLRCPESEAERRVDNAEPAALRVLSSITLLDPAVGSGAFLLGALERLSSLPVPGAAAAILKRRVLRQNLFGVDQSAAAVRLTELRLWLAVIADDPAEHPEAVSPLPNLDCLIRQGDSLFDPIGPGLGIRQAHPELAGELSQLRREVITASGAPKRTLVRRLQAVEARALDASLAAAAERHLADVAECLRQARAHDLFGRPRGLDRELHTRLTHLRARLRQLRQARRRLARDGEVPWFHYQSHFADVFAAGGFAVVIGNPPWRRSEAMPADLRARLGERYRWWRAGGRGYGNGPDLAVAFVERALELTAPGGVVALLVPAKIASARYGAAARHDLASRTTLHAVADLSRPGRSGFDATVYPMALVASKATPEPGHRVRTGLASDGEEGVPQAQLCSGAPWILRSGIGRALAIMEQEHPRLDHSLACHLGLKTGINRVFLNPPGDLEAEVLRWAVRGRDVTMFGCDRRVRLLWTHDPMGRPRCSLPPRATAYLIAHEAALRARRDYQRGPFWTVFRARAAVARYRVIWSDLAQRLEAAALIRKTELDLVPLNTCYVAALPNGAQALALAAWLNSTWLRAAARAGAMPASGGYARFNAEVVGRLPLPGSALANGDLIRLARAGRQRMEVQTEIDAVVARLLALPSSAQSALRDLVDSSSRHRR